MSIPQIIAHRGNKSVAPENTLPAFVSAIKAGAGSIEMDVVLSRDGIAMIIHDETLDGTTSGSGDVGDFTCQDIQNLDAGSWFDPSFAGVRVPTFDEFAQLMAKHPHVEVLLEFKGDWSPEQAQTVVDSVNRAGIMDQTILQSFSRVTVESLLKIAPESRRGILIVEDFEELIDLAVFAKIYTINPEVNWVLENPDFVDRLHEAGIKTQVWTADFPEQWAALVDLGVDAIITDCPDRLAGWYAGRGLI